MRETSAPKGVYIEGKVIIDSCDNAGNAEINGDDEVQIKLLTRGLPASI